MKTTLSLDDDVAVALQRLRKVRGTSLKQLVNECLACGPHADARPPQAP